MLQSTQKCSSLHRNALVYTEIFESTQEYTTAKTSIVYVYNKILQRCSFITLVWSLDPIDSVISGFQCICKKKCHEPEFMNYNICEVNC